MKLNDEDEQFITKIRKLIPEEEQRILMLTTFSLTKIKYLESQCFILSLGKKHLLGGHNRYILIQRHELAIEIGRFQETSTPNRAFPKLCGLVPPTY